MTATRAPEPVSAPTEPQAPATVLAWHFLAYHQAREPQVVSFRFGGGATVYQNSRGRCEDAPCCGYCS